MFDLKAFRQKNNLTQKDVARIFSCNQNFISRVENGVRPIPKDKMDILSSIYGDISEYTKREGEMLRAPKTDGKPTESTAATPDGKADNGTLEGVLEGMVELQKGYQQMLAKSQEQIDRLLTIIEKRNS